MTLGENFFQYAHEISALYPEEEEEEGKEGKKERGGGGEKERERERGRGGLLGRSLRGGGKVLQSLEKERDDFYQAVEKNVVGGLRFVVVVVVVVVLLLLLL